MPQPIKSLHEENYNNYIKLMVDRVTNQKDFPTALKILLEQPKPQNLKPIEFDIARGITVAALMMMHDEMALQVVHVSEEMKKTTAAKKLLRGQALIGPRGS